MTWASSAQSSNQMQVLMQASLAVTTEPSLERVLQKIAEVARDVLCARYAVLGVIDERGTGLSQFLAAGIDEAGKAAIGLLPTGQGVLGLLISERRPIRIRRPAEHSLSGGVPANHPLMESFLGVPIMVRDKAYGHLYVTEKQGGGEFSEADEQVALMLASQAGIGIENALTSRALAEARDELARRERMATELNAQMQALMQASLALTTEPSLERVLQKVAEVARDALRARYAALGVIDESGTGLSQFLTAGIDEAGKAAIGLLPTGRRGLELLIEGAAADPDFAAGGASAIGGSSGEPSADGVVSRGADHGPGQGVRPPVRDGEAGRRGVLGGGRAGGADARLAGGHRHRACPGFSGARRDPGGAVAEGKARHAGPARRRGGP